MTKQHKLIEKIRSRPKNFTWKELCALMTFLGYELKNGSGSRRRFLNAKSQAVMTIHEPHPRNYLLEYQVKAVLEHLENKGLI